MTEGIFDIKTKQQYIERVSDEELTSYLEDALELTEG